MITHPDEGDGVTSRKFTASVERGKYHKIMSKTAHRSAKSTQQVQEIFLSGCSDAFAHTCSSFESEQKPLIGFGQK